MALFTFLATQVAIDCETGYHLLRSEYPLHRFFHTLLGATVVGCAVALIVVAVSRRVTVGARLAGRFWWPSEISSSGALVAGVVGGTSHSVLDGFVHADVQPFWPLSGSNPLYGRLGWGTVEVMCALMGTLGAVLLAWQGTRRRTPL